MKVARTNMFVHSQRTTCCSWCERWSCLSEFCCQQHSDEPEAFRVSSRQSTGTYRYSCAGLHFPV